MSTTIQLRRDTAANWTSANPTLAAGESGVELDTGNVKIGTGSANWNSLPYTVTQSLAWVASREYAVGQLVVESGTLYECTTANNDATFTVGHWASVGGGGATLTIIPETANFNVSTMFAEYDVTSASAVTATIPLGTGAAGDWFAIAQLGAGAVTLAGASGVSFASGSVLTTTGQSQQLTAVCVSTNNWRVVASQASGGGPLAVVQYTSSGWTSSSLTLVAVDSTNLTMSFTAPASGRVILRAAASVWNSVNSNGITLGWVTHNTTTTFGLALQMVVTAAGSPETPFFSQLVTGLSGSYQIDLAWSEYTTGTLSMGPTVLLEAWGA